ncbi:MAG: hypothetical protein JXO49_02265 [Deltaproteobacteria bacterium]|nr:hypothetical protein [Candidatus Anaeroferrophillus wilburensis]MBN2888152.1 hypothetical protein [Deltaproteobacteria bacterium]
MKRSFSLFFQVLLLFQFAACQQPATTKQPLESLFPETIGTLQRLQLVTEGPAIDRINQLHGKTIEVEAGAIGRYAAGGSEVAMVWISRSSDEQTARRQTDIMVEKMVNNPRSPFHHPQIRGKEGARLYQFMGMGQVHYIFCRQTLVYWISAVPARGEEILATFYPLAGNSS